MIAYLKGTVKLVRIGWLILDVDSVGYKVGVGPQIISDVREGDNLELFIYTQVKEDILALHGFRTVAELDFFELLISVSGIGPKAAMGILAAASIDKIRASIMKQDPSLLSSVSGIGKKTAEKVVIELKNKVGSTASIFDNAITDKTEDVYDALLGLGFKPIEAREAVGSLPDDCASSEAQLKYCLSMLKK